MKTRRLRQKHPGERGLFPQHGLSSAGWVQLKTEARPNEWGSEVSAQIHVGAQTKKSDWRENEEKAKVPSQSAFVCGCK